MKILIINAGSSSIKFSVFNGFNLSTFAFGLAEKIGSGDSRITIHVNKENGVDKHVEIKELINHYIGFKRIIELLQDEHINVIQNKSEITAIGHRVVHGGDYYTEPVFVTKDLKKKIKKFSPLAPLHNPNNLSGIEVCEKILPKIPQVAVFDTAFHQTIPEKVFRYAIPSKYFHEYGVRVYGMHGTSHKYITWQTAGYLKKPVEKVNLISVHLGNGCSISAVKNGQCIDTSMGMSPLPGLMMGTRAGDIDPSIIFHLLRHAGMNAKQVENMLNNESGLKAIAGTLDVRDVIDRMNNGENNALLALEMYCYRIKKYIGSYLAILGDADAIVFTAGVGENSAYIRKNSLSNMSQLGVEIDNDINYAHKNGISEISKKSSTVKVLVIPTNEEKQIALSTMQLLEPILAQQN